MHLSILLRVALEPLEDDRVAGRAEIVETGETAIFSDAGQLLLFVQGATRTGRTGRASRTGEAAARPDDFSDPVKVTD